MTDVTDFIQATIADKPIAAQNAFAAAMDDRVQDALTFKYDEVSQQVFNPTDPGEESPETQDDWLDEYEDSLDDEETTDLETGMEEQEDV